MKNPFDLMMKEAQRKGVSRVIVFWNRGLGDIPLGLYAFVQRTHLFLPDARIIFITRKDLAPMFELLEGCEAISSPNLIRGEKFDADQVLELLDLPREDGDLVFESLNPTKWFKWQIGNVVPKLKWKDEWDEKAKRFDLPQNCIGVHIDTETGQYYRYNKNWPADYWTSLFQGIDQPILIFGSNQEDQKWPPNVIDLRGKTDLLELISIIKNYCSHLVVPDSGILSIIYYIDANFPIKVVSLWADPKQGVLRQKVASPNINFSHHPLVGKGGDLRKVSALEVLRTLQQQTQVGIEQ